MGEAHGEKPKPARKKKKSKNKNSPNVSYIPGLGARPKDRTPEEATEIDSDESDQSENKKHKKSTKKIQNEKIKNKYEDETGKMKLAQALPQRTLKDFPNLRKVDTVVELSEESEATNSEDEEETWAEKAKREK